ncbi:hypothetical protein SAMN04515656_104155 [Eubacterium aggregans]|uniref:Uncharacterized protein n=1 Tax=Eubacterium aggregans TaxID=81409 RepID=A0A1H3YXS2_9FIRM|nr:hypothetical protein [Eubacterium aggregans]SEA16207.1 hypothetical protein SAMN04515656_104155 [Eubacterium aggregans]
MYFLRTAGDYIGFVVDGIHTITESDVPITDADYNKYFESERQGKVFRMRATPDTQSGLFGYIEEYVPEPISTQPSEIQPLQLALAEAIEKQEADKLELQLALAEFIESQVEGGV